MSWQDATFPIVKQSDKDIISALNKVFEESAYQFSTASFDTYSSSRGITVQPGEIDTNEDLSVILEEGSDLIQSFIYNINHGIQIRIKRNPLALRDEVIIPLKKFQSGQPATDAQKISHADFHRFIGLLKKHLKAISIETSIAASEGDVAHLELVGTQMQHLRSIVEDSLKTLHEGAIQLRTEQEKQVQAEREALQTEFDKRKSELDRGTEERKSELDRKERELEEKTKDVDARESKYVRREIRQKIKERLQEEIQITDRTRNLRWSIYGLFIVLLLVFGVGTVATAIEGFKTLFSGDQLNVTQAIAVAVKQVTFAAVFTSTAIFFIRWQNRWFEKNVAEEFRLRWLELDIERASWVLEMALEWREGAEGAETELPPVILERFTHNLFVDVNEAEKALLHPTEQLAAQLLGVAAEVKLKAPGGSELTLDRKSVKKIEKS